MPDGLHRYLDEAVAAATDAGFWTPLDSPDEESFSAMGMVAFCNGTLGVRAVLFCGDDGGLVVRARPADRFVRQADRVRALVQRANGMEDGQGGAEVLDEAAAVVVWAQEPVGREMSVANATRRLFGRLQRLLEAQELRRVVEVGGGRSCTIPLTLDFEDV